MKRHIAVVSAFEIREYFAGDAWKVKENDDGSIDAKSGVYDIRLTPGASKYSVKIWAEDDPSDSAEEVTDQPVKFIADFLSTGASSEDLLKKMSSRSGQWHLPALLRHAAFLLDVNEDPKAVAKIVRRGMVASFSRGFERLFEAVVRVAAGFVDDSKEVQKVTKEMKEKGWKVTQDTDDQGNPVLQVDVSGIYTAEIRARETTWSYSFQVQDIPESKEEGKTSDPIQQFRLFYKKDSTQDFKKQLKDKRDSSRTDKKEEGTAPAGKASEEKTAPTKRPGAPASGKPKVERPDVDATGDTQFAPTRLPPSSKADVQAWNKYSD